MIAQIDIEIARPADAGMIAELSRDAIEFDLPWRWTARRVGRSIRDSSTNVIVARKGSTFLGFGIMKYEDEASHLLLMAVAAGFRRQGVATAMLAWLEATSRAAGVPKVEVESRSGNKDALAFYRKNGFRNAGLFPGYYDGKEDAFRLVKDLSGLGR